MNQTLAQRLWPGQPALGKRVTMKGQTIEVVGVVRDIKGRNLFEPPGPMLYRPLSQAYQPSVVLHLRTATPPESLIPALRREVAALDPDLPVYSVMPLNAHVAAAQTPQRLLAYLIGGFGLLALTLSAIGLYGLMAHTVTARTQEIGIRMALGARREDVMRLFVGRGMTLALLGVVLGSAAALELTPLIKGLLFGVEPFDPVTLLLTPAVLCAAALAACGVPAYRAAGADPKIALRYE